MSTLGALLAALSAIAAILASRRTSAVVLRLARLGPRAVVSARIRSHFVTAELERSGLCWSELDLVRSKVIAGLACAAIAATTTLVVPIGPALVIAAAYGGFVFPTVLVDRASARRRAEADRALVALVEWTEALVSSGRPIETALVAVAANGVGAALVDGALSAASSSYALGAPLLPSLAREAERAGLSRLAGIATELERARDLGRGALAVLRDERDRLRSSERARSLDAASRVESQLMLVLVLCYLPALMLLVVIPLFLGLLQGLFV